MLVRAEYSQSSRDHPDTVTIHNCNGYQPRQQKKKPVKESERSAENTNLWETLIVSKIKKMLVQKHHPTFA